MSKIKTKYSKTGRKQLSVLSRECQVQREAAPLTDNGFWPLGGCHSRE